MCMWAIPSVTPKVKTCLFFKADDYWLLLNKLALEANQWYLINIILKIAKDRRQKLEGKIKSQ